VGEEAQQDERLAAVVICPIERPIYVSHHAEQRVAARYPEMRCLERTKMLRLVVREVADGIRAGRISVRQPRSTIWNGGQRRKGQGRFVRNEAGNHVYAVKEDGGRLIVVTAYSVAPA